MVAQVGGSHYGQGYLHWDLTTEIGMDYLTACASKYIDRLFDKKGQEILSFDKAVSYIDKAILEYDRGPWRS